jgi:poly(A) polymerase Pap1
MVDHIGSGGKESEYVDDGTSKLPEVGEDGKTTISMEMTTFYIGLVTSTKKLDFGWEINDFTNLVHQWDSYDVENMALSVNFLRR